MRCGHLLLSRSCWKMPGEEEIRQSPRSAMPTLGASAYSIIPGMPPRVRTAHGLHGQGRALVGRPGTEKTSKDEMEEGHLRGTGLGEEVLTETEQGKI